MAFRLMEMFVELTVKGSDTLKAALGGAREQAEAVCQATKAAGAEADASLSQAVTATNQVTAALVQAKAAAQALTAITYKSVGMQGLFAPMVTAAPKEKPLDVIPVKTFREQLVELGKSAEVVFDKMMKGAATFARMATIGFAAVTASLTGFVRAGLVGTGAGALLSFEFQQLSRQIAGVFLPVVEKITDKIRELTTWFRKLTGNQQDQIMWWSSAAAAALGFASIGPKVVTAIVGIATAAISTITAISSAAGVLNVLTAGLPILVGALVAGGAALTAFTIGTKEGREALRELWGAAKPLLAELMEAAKAILPSLAAAFRAVTMTIRAMTGQMNELGAVGAMLRGVWGGVKSEWELFFGWLREALDQAIDGFAVMAAAAATAANNASKAFRVAMNPVGALLDGSGSDLLGEFQKQLADIRKALRTPGAEDEKPHREPGGMGRFESVTDSYKRIQQAANLSRAEQAALDALQVQKDMRAHLGGIREDLGRLQPAVAP